MQCQTKLVIVLLALLLLSKYCSAQFTIVLSPQGSDVLSNGTISNPFLTVQKAISVAPSTRNLRISLLAGSYYIQDTLMFSNIEGPIVIEPLNFATSTTPSSVILLPKPNNTAKRIRLAYMSNVTNVILRGITFQDAVFAGSKESTADFYSGAGLSITDSSNVNITDCTFSNLIAVVGGALYIKNSNNVVLERCIFSNNQVYFNQDKIMQRTNKNVAVDNSMLLMNSPSYTKSIDKNSATGGALAVSNVTSITVLSCIFSVNFAGIGGAAHFSNSQAIVHSCIFQRNAVYFQASAIFAKEGSVSIFGCDFIRNQCMTRRCRHIEASGFLTYADLSYVSDFIALAVTGSYIILFVPLSLLVICIGKIKNRNLKEFEITAPETHAKDFELHQVSQKQEEKPSQQELKQMGEENNQSLVVSENVITPSNHAADASPTIASNEPSNSSKSSSNNKNSSSATTILPSNIEEDLEKKLEKVDKMVSSIKSVAQESKVFQAVSDAAQKLKRRTSGEIEDAKFIAEIRKNLSETTEQAKVYFLSKKVPFQVDYDLQLELVTPFPVLFYLTLFGIWHPSRTHFLWRWFHQFWFILACASCIVMSIGHVTKILPLQDDLDSSRIAIEVVIWCFISVTYMVLHICTIITFRKSNRDVIYFLHRQNTRMSKIWNIYIPFLALTALVFIVLAVIIIVLILDYFYHFFSIEVVQPVFGVALVFTLAIYVASTFNPLFILIVIGNTMYGQITRFFRGVVAQIEASKFSLEDALTRYILLKKDLGRYNDNTFVLSSSLLVTGTVLVVLAAVGLLLGPSVETTNVIDAYKHIFLIAFYCVIIIGVLAVLGYVSKTSLDWANNLDARISIKALKSKSVVNGDLVTFLTYLKSQYFVYTAIIPMDYATMLTIAFSVTTLLSLLQVLSSSYESSFYTSYKIQLDG